MTFGARQTHRSKTSTAARLAARCPPPFAPQIRVSER